MTYDLRERSQEEGEPIWCYLFRLDSLTIAYTTSDRVQEVNNIRFLSGSQISDDGQQATGESQASTKRIRLSVNSELANLYKEYTPALPVTVTVWAKHVGDLDFAVSWIGDVMDVAWPDLVSFELNCMSLSATMSAQGLTRCWQRSCSNVLYDVECGVPQTSYRTEVSVEVLNGLVVSVLGLDPVATPDGYFTGGIAEWTTPEGVRESRGIRQHAGANLTLLGGTAGIRPLTNLTLYPGCDLTIATCAAKYGNVDNFGGQPHQPGRSPFDGNQVF